MKNPQLYYILGSSCLFATAAYFRLFFFIALELILISGHSAILLGTGPYIQFALPILLCVQLLFFFYINNLLYDPFRVIGVIGISLLSIGFAYEREIIFFLGGVAISTFAFYSAFKGRYPCYIWGVLNFLFAAHSFFKLIS